VRGSLQSSTLRARYVVLLLAVIVLASLVLYDRDSTRSSRAARAAGNAPESADPAPAGDGAETTDPARTEGSTWWLTFLGPGGRPLPDVPVTVFPEAVQVVRTDASGTATLTGPKGTGVLAVGDPFTSTGRLLQKRRTVVRLPGLLPLDVQFRAVDTGRPVTPSNVRLVGCYGEFALENGRTAMSPFSTDRSHSVDVVFDVPPGYTTLDGLRYELSPTLSVDAAHVRATVVLWPELDLTVRVVDLDERPVEGATVKAAYLDRQYDVWVREVHVAAKPTDREGRTRVRGVPHVVGLPLTVAVEGPADDGFEETTIPSGKLELKVVACVDKNAWSPPGSTIGIGGGPGPRPEAALEGEVFCRDGRPAAGVRIAIQGPNADRAKTDAGGRFRVDHLQPGRYTVWLIEPGLVPTSALAEVGSEGVASVTLREAEGWTLRVRTVDAEGRPQPFRPLAVVQTESRAPYALLQGSTQVVPLLTGPDGTLALTNLGREAVEVSVRIRGRDLAQATVAYPREDGAAVELRLP